MTKGQSLAIIESNSLLGFHNILDYFLFKGCKAYQDINNQEVILKIYLRKIMTKFSIIIYHLRMRIPVFRSSKATVEKSNQD